MDRQFAIDRNRIKHIVALLFALAVLAERAAARPLAVRVFVNWLLLRAEFAALTLFMEPDAIEACAARQAPPQTEPETEPSDLIRLAVSLRALAMLLAAGCTAPSGGRQRASPRLAVARPRILQPGSGPAGPNDTS